MKWYFVLLMIASADSQQAQAQDVRRCVEADGSVQFTDRACTDQQQEKLQQLPLTIPNTGTNMGTKPYIALPPSCNRSPDDLLYGIRSAIDMNDVNQLAKHYHWPGVSDAQAEQLMNRLELLVNSPLLDIQLLYPVLAENQQTLTDIDHGSDAGLDETTELNLAPETRHVLPYALRVQQYLSNTSNQIQSSTFRLQRHFECWWIRY